MPPLKLAKVKANILRMVAVGGTKTTLVVPVHKKNLDEFHRLADWWQSIGGGAVVPLPFTNRGSFSPEVLNLHLAPVSGICRHKVAFDFIVDWDGEVLSCCQDFPKVNGIGDLRKQSVREIISSEQRKKLFTMLKNQEWGGIEMCRTCVFDDPEKMAEALAAAAAQH